MPTTVPAHTPSQVGLASPFAQPNSPASALAIPSRW